MTSDRDVHGRMRMGQRDGDGKTYPVVVRDMSSPSGAPTTVLDALTESQLQSRIDRGWWE